MAVRARLATALFVRRMRLSMGDASPEDFDEDEDAEAGALVEAEDVCDVTTIRDMIRAYLEAMAKAPRAS